MLTLALLKNLNISIRSKVFQVILEQNNLIGYAVDLEKWLYYKSIIKIDLIAFETIQKITTK